jgi:hypothetical protein
MLSAAHHGDRLRHTIEKTYSASASPSDSIKINATTQLQVRKVYIKAQDSLTLERLASGDYSVFFQTGEDWDNSTEDFNRHASYYQFGKNLAFEETSDSEGIHYEHHAITLQPVPSGNVHSTSLSKSQFHALVGGM